MGWPLPWRSSTLSSGDPYDESFLHFLARESRVVLRIALLVLLGVTLLMMATFWYWAIVPALLLLGVYLALVIADAIERYTDRPPPPSSADAEAPRHARTMLSQRAGPADRPEGAGEEDVYEAAPPPDPVGMALIKRETLIVTALLTVILVAAFIIAALFMPPTMIILAAIVLFAYMLLVAAPVWIGGIEDDIEDETRRLRHEPKRL